MRRAAALAAAALALASAAPARGALPPAYGGVVRWPAPHALRAPSPTTPRSPFEAALAHAVYGGLYALTDEGAVAPDLAAALPEPVEGGHRIRLREGLVRHDGRPLDAEDVLRSLERSLASGTGAFLLAPLAGEDGRLAASVEPDGAIALREALGADELARRLAALPCAIAPAPTPSGRSRGTGPFRAVATADGVELRAFRRAAPAAPYLGTIAIAGPRTPERELRDLELGRLHASWFGASLYGAPSRPTDALELATSGVVVVVGDPSARDALAWLAAHVDRERLRRAGVEPSESIAPSLRAPAHRRAGAPRSLALRVAADDAFAGAIARELAAQADARGVTASVSASAQGAAGRSPSSSTPAQGAAGRSPSLSVVTVVPPLPGDAAALAAAFVAAGQPERAAVVGLSDERAREASPRLAAVVLGRRRDVLFHQRGLHGLRTDAYGLPALPELHLRRRSAMRAESSGGAP